MYVDDAVSGAEFAKRPGYVRLLNALSPRAPFDVLVVSELSRLGREQLETGYAVKQLSQAGVAIWSYLEAREMALDSATDRFLMSAVAFAADVEREKAAARVRDAMRRRAERGYVCGGEPFGYRNRMVTGLDGRKSHVEREVYEPEAAIVRRIFALAAAGKGLRQICKTLNAEGAPAPRPKAGRPRSWASSSVRTILYREAYRGVAVWNRRKGADQWGQNRPQRRPESEWIRVDAPHLRVVDEEAWKMAHARLSATRENYLRDTGGRVFGRPASGLESQYLLAGFGRCGCCGGGMIVRHASRRRQGYYVCAYYNDRGRTACGNGMRLPMEMADAAILDQFADVLLAPAVVTGAIDDAVAALRPDRDTVAAQRDLLGAELRRLEAEAARFVAAVAAAGDVPALAAALRENAAASERVRRELAALDATDRLAVFDRTSLERNLRKRLDDWRGLLRRNTKQARQIVGSLLDGRVTWTPGDGHYDYSGRASYGRLLSGLVVTAAVVPVRGFEPRFDG